MAPPTFGARERMTAPIGEARRVSVATSERGQPVRPVPFACRERDRGVAEDPIGTSEQAGRDP
jgi:hypothetical protein